MLGPEVPETRTRAFGEAQNSVGASPSRPQSQQDPSDAAYALIRQQTGQRAAANRAGLLAAILFVIAAVWVLVALELGADIRQVLIGGLVIVCVNVVAALVWQARTSRRR